MMGETVEQGRGHLGVSEDGRPFAEGEVCGDDDRGSLVEPAQEVEEQLSAGLGEGQVAEFVEDDEVAPGELVGGAALASGADLRLEAIDRVDDVVEAAACALADAGPRDGDGEMGLSGAGGPKIGQLAPWVSQASPAASAETWALEIIGTALKSKEARLFPGIGLASLR